MAKTHGPGGFGQLIARLRKGRLIAVVLGRMLRRLIIELAYFVAGRNPNTGRRRPRRPSPTPSPKRSRHESRPIPSAAPRPTEIEPRSHVLPVTPPPVAGGALAALVD